MSKPTTKSVKTTLVVSASDRGGDGKTTGLVLVADYLATAGHTFSPVDCDMGNCDTPAGFSHWFNSPVTRYDLRSIDDCDMLLTQAAQSGLGFVLADFPANSSTDLVEWLEQSASPGVLTELGLRLIAACPVDQSSGAPESAAAWMAAFGERAEYLIMLNRKGYERKSKANPTDTAFSAWKKCVERGVITRPFKTVEIGSLHAASMEALIGLRELPHKAIRNPKMPILYRDRIQRWSRDVHNQLAKTGLFGPDAQGAKEAAAA